jgi:hypothetical protein
MSLYYFKDANTRAEQVYGPVVERRQRVEKVRSTLYILQRYRFLFNLPSSLLESIKQVNDEKGECRKPSLLIERPIDKVRNSD